MELWHVPLRIDPDGLSRAAAVLDGAELDRAARFRRAADREGFIAAHAALRRILGHRLARAPQSLRFEIGPEGKPALQADQARGLAFNLSHSGPYGVIALSREAPVGVDIEAVEQAAALADPQALDAVCSAAEQAAIAGFEPAAQPLARLRCWVRKEALLKAAGCGLSDAVRALTVSVGDEARLVASAHPLLQAGDWSLAPFERPGLWIGALATRGPMPRVSVRHWTWTWT